MRSKVKAIGIALCCLGLTSLSALACVVHIPNFPCPSIGQQSVIFIGTPVGTAPLDRLLLQDPPVLFLVEQALFGLPVGVETVAVLTGSNNSCGVKFKEGVRYLMYTRRMEGETSLLDAMASFFRYAGSSKLNFQPLVETNMGSGSLPLADADEEWSFLNIWLQGQRHTVVRGSVLPNSSVTATGQPAGRWVNREGMTIFLEDLKGNEIASTQLDRYNAYHFSGVAEGEYQLRVGDKHKPIVRQPLHLVGPLDGCTIALMEEPPVVDNPQ